MTLRQLLALGENNLFESGKDLHNAKLYLLHLFKYESHKLILNLDKELSDKFCQDYLKVIDMLVEGIPLQHITGVQFFYGRDFIVNNQVLIPRYETEELVENVLYLVDDYYQTDKEVVIADIGTGSGAIAISLDLEDKKCKVYATDISFEALEVAKQNIEKFNSNVITLQGDLLEPLIEKGIKLDILVSNPPYIKETEEIDSIVKDHEPHIALYGKDDGLYFYDQLLSKAHLVLKEKSILAFEIGFDLKESLIKIVTKYFPNQPYEVKKDLYGNNRMLFIYNNLKRRR